MNNVEVWLWILLVMLPHNSRTAELLKAYGSALEAARAMRDGECGILTEQEKKRVQSTRSREVKALIAECEKHDIRIVTLDDEEYPARLRSIENPPVVLFVRGSLSRLNGMPSLAAVGPRSPSEYGRKAAALICGELAANGAAIISGLAVGIDAAAHRAAVDCNGVTVGVLGCGMLVNYPAENEELKAEIVQKGGAVISELLPNTAVTSAYFRHRNRIISGLGLGTFVVEASTRSGALLTADHALKQGRCVFVVPPHDIFTERFCGVFPLLDRGAVCVSGAEDICRRLASRYADTPEYQSLKRLESAFSEKERRAPAKKAAPKGSAPVVVSRAEAQPEKAAPKAEEKPAPTAAEKPAKASEKPVSSGLGERYDRVAELLREKPLTADDIIAKCGISYNELCEILLELELNDVITRNRDATYSMA